jgi:hypothetical protein
MEYQQRHVEASAYYQAGLRRVNETPPPAGQKFPLGARVKIANDLGPHMRHFPSGKLATVQYTYAHAYGSTDTRSHQQYRIDIDGIGSVAWYDEYQLSAIPETEDGREAV